MGRLPALPGAEWRAAQQRADGVGQGLARVAQRTPPRRSPRRRGGDVGHAAAGAARSVEIPLAITRYTPHVYTRLQAALDLLIRLNDRFALDGGAPPSYGGLLWCLGWRDRPGTNGRPTARPTSVMARRVSPRTTRDSACNHT
jgi:hypothetical protein